MQVVKSRRMRWARHVERIGERRGVHRVLVGEPEGTEHTGIAEDDYIILGYCIDLRASELLTVRTAQCHCNCKDICIFPHSVVINSDCIH